MSAALIVSVLLVVSNAAQFCDTAEGRWVDLTHPFDNTTVGYPGLKPFSLRITDRRVTEEGYWLQMEEYGSAIHVGTHMDAPCHIVKDQWSIEDIPISRFIAPAAVVDISLRTSKDRDANLEVEDLIMWEERNRRTLNGTIVLVNTGWSQKWWSKKEFLGTESDDASQIHFPGVSPEAAEWIENNRMIYGLGIDTLSLDNGQANGEFKAHRSLFRANIYGLENVNIPYKLPDYGVELYVFPMRIKGACGSPVRIMALLPNDGSY